MKAPKDKNGRELTLGDTCTNGTRYFKIEVIGFYGGLYTVHDGTGWMYKPEDIEKL